MNERIKELWENSDTIEVCYPEQGSPVSVSATTLEKFAELIVQEFVKILETEIVVGANTTVFNQDEWNKNNMHFTLLTNMVTLTKEHFGVKE